MKRYNTPEEIIETIDRYKVEMGKLATMAELLDKEADAARDGDNPFDVEKLRGEAAEVRKRIQWREARLATLSERLAVIQTPVLPAMDDGDSSIPAVA